MVRKHKPQSHKQEVVKQTSNTLLSNALLNKGMAFTLQERFDFHLLGLLPPKIAQLHEQCTRCYDVFCEKKTDLDKYVYLSEIQDFNETLFYALLSQHIEEMMPLIYTPTVGLACERISHTFRRPRGLFISYQYVDYIENILANPRFKETKIIVVTDGERILGLGDQGAGGIGIPIGKLALYTLCAGIHPKHTLPIILDTGTNNPTLLKDPLYIGWPHQRIRGHRYAEFIDVFIKAVKKRFPQVILQWEDFSQKNANKLLNTYQNEICSFNDDIQGTAAVVAGTVLCALKKIQQSIIDQRIVIAGAGSAGCGIGSLIVQLMQEEGLSEGEAKSRLFLIDKNGLLISGDKHIVDFQKNLVTPKNMITHWNYMQQNNISLYEVIKNVHPTILIGTSGQAGLFTKEMIKEMSAHTQHPIIFPLSNPTSRSEATPEQLLTWSKERAIIGTGSPFTNHFPFNQVNNSYIFPGVGLGLLAAQSKKVTKEMFIVAAKALANCSVFTKNIHESFLPPLTKIHEVSFNIALAVANEAISSGVSRLKSSENIELLIRENMWVPQYKSYKK